MSKLLQEIQRLEQELQQVAAVLAQTQQKYADQTAPLKNGQRISYQPGKARYKGTILRAQFSPSVETLGWSYMVERDSAKEGAAKEGAKRVYDEVFINFCRVEILQS